MKPTITHDREMSVISHTDVKAVKCNCAVFKASLFASGYNKEGYHLLLVEIQPQLRGISWCPNACSFNGTGKLLGNFTVMLF